MKREKGYNDTVTELLPTIINYCVEQPTFTGQGLVKIVQSMGVPGSKDIDLVTLISQVREKINQLLKIDTTR